MAYKTLTPDTGPQFVLPFGYDGVGFYGLRVDTSGLLVPALRVSRPEDRSSLAADIQWSGAAGNHATTTRATYTVPANRFAVVQNTYLRMTPIPATNTALAWVEVRGLLLNTVYGDPASTLASMISVVGHATIALPGDTITLRTYNGSATTINFYLQAHILEYAG